MNVERVAVEEANIGEEIRNSKGIVLISLNRGSAETILAHQVITINMLMIKN